MLYKRKAVLLAKIESVYGTDPTPDGADAIQVSDLSVKPAEGDKLKRNIAYPDMSTQSHIMTRQRQSVSFSVELKGNGTAVDSPPESGVLLRACGFSEAITAATSVAYQPVSEAFESATLYVNYDGVLHKLLGCRGSVKFEWPAGSYPKATFELMALSAAPADVAAPAPTYSSAKPLEVNEANTTFSFGGYAAVLHKLGIDMGWKTIFRSLPNQTAQVLITGRECAGNLTIDAVKQASKDYWTEWSNANALALSLVHGTEAANIVEASAAQVQLDTYDYGDAEGILTKVLPLALTRDAGDDELVLTFR